MSADDVFMGSKSIPVARLSEVSLSMVLAESSEQVHEEEFSSRIGCSLEM